MNKKILISPSIIAADLTVIGNEVAHFDPGVIDLLHMDVMDGRFVPNLTFGPGFIGMLKSHTSIPLDVHLMIENPELSVDRYIELNPWAVTIHHESTRFPARILSAIRQQNIRAGLSINPATPVEMIFDILPYSDMILIMSVDPGFYGQSFMEMSLKKIEALSSHIKKENYKNILIQVDGGINKENISRVVGAGADVIVAGNSAFKGGDVNKNVQELKNKAKV